MISATKALFSLGVKLWKFMVLPDVRLPEKTTLFDLTSSLLAAAAR